MTAKSAYRRRFWQQGQWYGLAALLAACAPSRYYEVPVVPPGFLLHVDDQAMRSRLLNELPARVAAVRVRQIEFGSQGVTETIACSPDDARNDLMPKALAKLPTPALAALYLTADPQARGAQWNLLIHQEPTAAPTLTPDSDVQVPLRVVHEPDGRVRIRQGAASTSRLAAPDHPPTADDLRQRFGITPSELGEPWSAPYYAALGHALAMLSQEELAFLARIPIAREHAIPETEVEHRTQARYLRVGGQARIELYDQMLTADETTFCGTVEKPRPSSACVLLHEIGHALADAANTSALAELATARTSLRAELAPLLRREAEQGPEALVSDAELRAVVDGVEHVEASAERVHRMGEHGPVLRRYRRARSVRKGPTPYGAHSLAESFAEAFALFRSDPEALQRIDPGAHAWFQREGHLHALAAGQ